MSMQNSFKLVTCAQRHRLRGRYVLCSSAISNQWIVLQCTLLSVGPCVPSVVFHTLISSHSQVSLVSTGIWVQDDRAWSQSQHFCPVTPPPNSLPVSWPPYWIMFLSLQADEDPIMGFHQMFLLKNINDAWVCTNDMFRLALHNFGWPPPSQALMLFPPPSLPDTIHTPPDAPNIIHKWAGLRWEWAQCAAAT